MSIQGRKELSNLARETTLASTAAAGEAHVGMPKVLARLCPTCNDLVQTPARGRPKAGSDSQPKRAMSARSRRTFLNFPPRLSHLCSTHTRHDPQRSAPRAPAAAPAPAPAARAEQTRHGQLDPVVGDDRAACATSGVLSTRTLPTRTGSARSLAGKPAPQPPCRTQQAQTASNLPRAPGRQTGAARQARD